MAGFYDQLAPLYHLIHEDWERSLQRQGEQLAQVLEAEWPGHVSLLDVSCGIGTQAIALAMRGYRVTASDLSPKEIKRAKAEADKRGQRITFSVCDMRNAHVHHGSGFDLAISCDNSIPHLLDDRQILSALEAMHACLAPGGGCLLTVRDYEVEERGKSVFKPHGVRAEAGKRYVLFQVWDFEGALYDLTFFFVEEDLSSHQVTTHVMRSRGYAISTVRLCELMREAGFGNVKRLDGVFYQPVLVGTKTA